MNSIAIIAPYKKHGVWMFDDPPRGLVGEPFVCGADTIIEMLSKPIRHAEDGFVLMFSANQFPNSTARFVLDRPENGGNWYSWPEQGIEGWLCPALFKYFDIAPAELHVSVRQMF